jgi:site-specific recombinase XerD
MLRRGATLDQIQTVLRHASPETTLQYAKVDVEALRAIAQPWPGGASC